MQCCAHPISEVIMHKSILRTIVVASSIVLAACSTTPISTSLLDEARNDFTSANANPAVGKYAPAELKAAGEALDAANVAAAKRESLATVDKFAYLAKQKTATAVEVAKGKASEAAGADASRQRDQLRLDARTAEAERAKADAERAKTDAALAQANAANANASAAEARERAARLEAMLIELNAKKTERGIIITIGDVLFATGQAQLTAAGMATARKLADVMTQYPERTVLVEGFTDSVGSDAYNQQLSERRAAAVRMALTGMGVNPDRVAMRGYGEAYPVAPNDTVGNRQLNRRVEIVLSNDGAVIPPRLLQPRLGQANKD
jgi:outer membrane protein OmpA-like peptidoglycan-associated protein